MTDKQLIDRLRRLVKSMYTHIDDGCTDYDLWDGLGGCADCKYAVHGRYECKKFEDIKRRMKECGIDWKELR